MRLSLRQKFSVLAGAFRSRRQLKRILVHNYFAQFKRFRLNYRGPEITFRTDDYYSTAWFFGQTQVDDFVYEPAITRIVVDRLARARGFADVGCNLGYFTVIAAKSRPDISIHAFELDGTLLPVISRNLEENGVRNVEVINAAIGDGSTPTVEFTPHAYSFLCKISGFDPGPFRVRLASPSMRLDEFFGVKAPRPDFLKIDVDGAEMAVLRGAPSLLAQDDVELLLEVHPTLLPNFGSSASEVIGHLRSLGFRCLRVSGFRGADAGVVGMDDVTDSPEVLQSPSGDMVYVTREPSRLAL